jgi:hypothetical protein
MALRSDGLRSGQDTYGIVARSRHGTEVGLLLDEHILRDNDFETMYMTMPYYEIHKQRPNQKSSRPVQNLLSNPDALFT